MTALHRLRQLEAAATPAPWTDDSPPSLSTHWRYYLDDEDVALIAAARNALPALLDLWEAVDRFWETMEWHPVEESDAVTDALRHLQDQP